MVARSLALYVSGFGFSWRELHYILVIVMVNILMTGQLGILIVLYLIEEELNDSNATNTVTFHPEIEMTTFVIFRKDK